jgi:hypothetical protein
MKEKQAIEVVTEWNLVLIGMCEALPAPLMATLDGAIVACGGWVLTRSAVSEHCVDIDFEFPRTHSIEMYSLLVAIGVELSREAHGQLTELCQCTRHIGEGEQSAVARVHLTVYTAEGSEDFLGSATGTLREAA